MGAQLTSRNVDVAIIGAGTAGMAAYRAAAQITDRVVLIEGGAFGTTCARVGCMPSKLLIAAAEAVHQASEAHHFGLAERLMPAVDGEKVMARVRSERDRFVGFVLRSVREFPERHVVKGRARFVDPHTLEVEGSRIHAARIVIATGSTPQIPAFFQGLGDRLVINDDVFDWTTLPASVAVFGPGVIGLELGQALHRLGVRVRVFGVGGAIGPLTDPELKAEALRLFGDEFPLDTDARVGKVERLDQGVRVHFRARSGEHLEEDFDFALVATGRVPALGGLALENSGLILDHKGIPAVDPTTLRCGDSHIFLAGDANPDRPLLHEAADEGRIAGENAGRYPDVQAGFRRSPLAIVFTDPQIAMVGSRFNELRERDIVVGRVSFEDQGRSRVMRLNQGALHLYADRATGQFLGAELIGPRAENLGHLLAWSHQQGLTIEQMLSMPFYHPVIEEGLRTALRDAVAQRVIRRAA